MKTIYLACALLLVSCAVAPDEPTLSEDDSAIFGFPPPFPPPTLGGPTMSSISPTVGPAGTVITVTGSGLLALRPPPPGFLPRNVVHLTNDSFSGPYPALNVTSDTNMTVTVAAGSFGGRIGVYDPRIEIDPFTGEASQRLISSSSQSFVMQPAAPSNLV